MGIFVFHGRILRSSFTYMYRLRIMYIHLHQLMIRKGNTYPKQLDWHVSQTLLVQ